MKKKKWLIINFNLPTKPSRHRVATWRGLKKSGAVNIQQSMWILPCTEDNLSALEKIFLFNNMRDQEYKEFINDGI